MSFAAPAMFLAPAGMTMVSTKLIAPSDLGSTHLRSGASTCRDATSPDHAQRGIDIAETEVVDVAVALDRAELAGIACLLDRLDGGKRCGFVDLARIGAGRQHEQADRCRASRSAASPALQLRVEKLGDLVISKPTFSGK